MYLTFKKHQTTNGNTKPKHNFFEEIYQPPIIFQKKKKKNIKKINHALFLQYHMLYLNIEHSSSLVFSLDIHIYIYTHTRFGMYFLLYFIYVYIPFSMCFMFLCMYNLENY